MARFYPLILMLQAFCLYHAYTNKIDYKWYFLILFFPFIGSLIYVYSNIYSPSKVGAIKDEVSEGIKETFVKNHKINKLERELEFSDTFTNKMELAEEHSRVGNYGRAISLYESCNTGVHANDAELSLKLLRNHYLAENHDEVVKHGRKLYGIKEFANSKEKTAYAWSLFKVGEIHESEEVFKEMDVRYSNYQQRLEYAYFLEDAGKLEDALTILQELMEEIHVMDMYEKKLHKVAIKDIKIQYNHLRNL